MLTSLINKFSEITGYGPDRVFEFLMDFDSMDSLEIICTQNTINVMVAMPNKVVSAILSLSPTDIDHCTFIMPKDIMQAFREYPDIGERYLEFFPRLINRDLHDSTDIKDLTICYADVVKTFNCQELLQQYYKNMVDEINFGL